MGADCSFHGLAQSFGVMASYRYHPAHTEAPSPVDAQAALDELLAWLATPQAA